MLIVFDRLLGTYRAERDDPRCRDGLVKPVTSGNTCASKSTSDHDPAMAWPMQTRCAR